MIQEGGRVSFRLSLQTRRLQYFSRQQTTDTGARHPATGETIRQDSAGLHQVPVPAAGRARVPGAGGRGQVHQQIFFIKHKIFFFIKLKIFSIFYDMQIRPRRGAPPEPAEGDLQPAGGRVGLLLGYRAAVARGLQHWCYTASRSAAVATPPGTRSSSR